ncbi:MAG: 3'-5' exonuclease [Clostridia bacterium]|nr:3'-5' exonuclease [Clostridia bacterium]
MNDMQKQAVFTTRNPLLILAGAGSGKTTVLVNRIANILRWGEAYESDAVFGEYSDEEIDEIKKAADGEITLSDELADRLSVSKVNPWRILAITFTNKAANELKDRICSKVGQCGNDIWASTFHSACTRILRRYGENIGYSNHFTIYDTDDQKRLLKDCIKALNIDEKIIPAKSVLSAISRAKDEMKTPDMLKSEAGKDSRLISIAKVYALYQQRLLASDAMDFDDIIFNTVILFKECPDVLEKYQEQFRYIMVDEYQDTNKLQYELIRLLADKHKNLCVVGDDDQSIYKFRGATIRNILDFEKDYENARVIKLEQNYRSTKNILTAANYVIKNNAERKGKTLWTQNEQGSKITWYNASDETDEGTFITNTINEQVAAGAKYSDFAILYRMNTQSQVLERVFVRSGIPYKIIGGHRFYDRREIRDMIAYLNVISNHHDNNRLKRIINVPKRGIGDKTVSQIEEIGNGLGLSMFETMKESDEFEVLAKSRTKLEDFCNMIEEFSDMLDDGMSVSDMYDKLVERIDYLTFIKHESERGDAAVENVMELKSSIAQYEQDCGSEATLQGFLEEVALMSDIDNYNEADANEKVVMMTLHSAKGLEFPTVFIPGMEENVFPGFQATMSSEDMQEERRLAYVGITRAKKNLYLINSDSRMLYGHTTRNRPSRFLNELPEQLVEKKRKEIKINPNIQIPEPKVTRRDDIAKSRIISSGVTKKPTVTYTVGMRVSHKVFGEGTVLSVKPMASDSMLEIAFDNVGTKKLMASFAHLTVLS